MQTELIGTSTVKVTLSAADLSLYSLDYDMIDTNSAPTRRLVSDILDRLLLTRDIDLTSEKLYIEVFPVKSGGCLMYISDTKGGNLKPVDTPEDTVQAVVTFRTTEELTACAADLDSRIGKYILFSRLYRSDTEFELIVGIDRREIIRTLKKLSGYQDAVLSGGSGIKAAYIEEHHEVVIARNAVQKLKRLN